MVIIALEENPTGTQVKSRLSLNGFIFKFFTWIKAFTKIGSAFWCFKFFTWIKAFTKIGCAFWCLVLLGLVVLKNILTGPLFQKPELDTKQIVLIAAHIAFYSTIVLSPVHNTHLQPRKTSQIRCVSQHKYYRSPTQFWVHSGIGISTNL